MRYAGNRPHSRDRKRTATTPRALAAGVLLGSVLVAAAVAAEKMGWTTSSSSAAGSSSLQDRKST